MTELTCTDRWELSTPTCMLSVEKNVTGVGLSPNHTRLGDHNLRTILTRPETSYIHDGYRCGYLNASRTTAFPSPLSILLLLLPVHFASIVAIFAIVLRVTAHTITFHSTLAIVSPFPSVTLAVYNRGLVYQIPCPVVPTNLKLSFIRVLD